MSKIALNGELFDLRGPAGPDGNPIGTIISFMGFTAPKDYVICDGSVYKISDYPNLAKFFKQQFGDEGYFGSSGDGTFAVPDMRNLFLRGYHGDANDKFSEEIGVKQEGTSHPAFKQGVGSNGSPYASFSAPSSGGVEPNNCDSRTFGVATQWLRSSEFNSSSTILSYVSRPVNMAVLYCIKAVDSQTVYETFEEYDVTVDACDWHVRKWSNGYVEMKGLTYLTFGPTAQWGPLYRSTAPASISRLPVPLVKIISKNYSLIETSSGVPILLIVTTDEPLTRTNGFQLGQAYSQNDSIKCTISISITGCWKEEVNEPIERVTSEVLPKSSGSIAKDGKQYDYELPSTSFDSFGSSSRNFNGIGSNAKF